MYILSSSRKRPDVLFLFFFMVSIGETAAVLYQPETIKKRSLPRRKP